MDKLNLGCIVREIVLCFGHIFLVTYFHTSDFYTLSASSSSPDRRDNIKMSSLGPNFLTLFLILYIAFGYSTSFRGPSAKSDIG